MIVIPIQTIHRLIDFSERHQLSISIPLMSSCSGYFAVDGMNQVLGTLMAINASEAHNLAVELQEQARQNHPVVRC